MKKKLQQFLLNKIALPILKRSDSDLQDEIALNIIRKHGGDSHMVKRFLSEADYAWRDENGHMDEMQSLLVENVIDALSLISMQGHSGYSIGYLKHYLNLGIDYKIISPLKFTDDEFREYCGPADRPSAQNIRMSCVFKHKDGVIGDINAIAWYNAARIDIDGTKNFDDYHGCFHGCVFVIRDLHNNEIIKADVNITNRDNFRGAHQNNIVPTVEVDDKNDTHNDFFCYVALESSIPQDFFKDYELIDTSAPMDYHEEKSWIEEHKEEMIQLCKEAEQHYKDEKNR